MVLRVGIGLFTGQIPEGFSLSLSENPSKTVSSASGPEA
jgi:hypothetical protein